MSREKMIEVFGTWSEEFGEDLKKKIKEGRRYGSRLKGRKKK